jgi:hypothetical protein
MRSRHNSLPTLLARWVSAASFLPAALFAAVAFAAAPYLAGPSVVYAGESAVFRGGNFASQDFVNVSTGAPDGASSSKAVATDPSGEVSIEVTPTVAGVYTLTVTDAQGASLVSVSFLVF